MNAVHCQLWMGNLEGYMTENFIIAAFRKMGEEPQTVRLMRNKFTGEPAGYCFVNFQSDEQAIDAMHKLNGKPIPSTNPVVRFRLNSASNSNKLPGNEREFSVWVGDLSSDVDDYSLYRSFSAKYTSIKTAKVILDTSGFSKGYGFVRFGLEDEQKAAMHEMNGFCGLGSKSLKICNAVPKPKTAMMGGSSSGSSLGNPPSFITGGSSSNSNNSGVSGSMGTSTSTDYSQYYDPTAYWAGYSAWQGYEQQQSHQSLQTPPVGLQSQTDYTAYYQQQAVAHAQQHAAAALTHNQQHMMVGHPSSSSSSSHDNWNQHHHHQQQHLQQQQHQQHYDNHQDDDDLALVDHKFTLDVEKCNHEILERDRNLWDALESSKWLPLEQLEIY